MKNSVLRTKKRMRKKKKRREEKRQPTKNHMGRGVREESIISSSFINIKILTQNKTFFDNVKFLLIN